MVSSSRIALGLAVYNGEKYLREAIETVLAQTYTNFTLLIADNDSTDTTAEICQEYLKQDSRIRYHRNATNIGAAPNFNFSFQPGDAPYFKWLAHDDVLAPDYLRCCVELLDADPTLAIAHSRSLVINEHGSKIGTADHEVRLNAACPSDRFWRILWAGYFCEVFGVMRSDYVMRTGMIRSYDGGDRTFMAEMLLQGNVAYVEDYLFSRRDHPDCYCRLDENSELRRTWYSTSKSADLHKLKGILKSRDYLTMILSSPIPWIERIRCLRMLSEWTIRRGTESMTGAGEQFGEQFREKCAIDQNYSEVEIS